MVTTRSSGPALQSSPALELRTREIQKSASPVSKKKLPISQTSSPQVVRHTDQEERGNQKATTATQIVMSEDGDSVVPVHDSESLGEATTYSPADATVEASSTTSLIPELPAQSELRNEPAQMHQVNANNHVKFADTDVDIQQLIPTQENLQSDESVKASGDETDNDAPMEMTSRDDRTQNDVAAIVDRASRIRPKKRRKELSVQQSTIAESNEVISLHKEDSDPEDVYPLSSAKAGFAPGQAESQAVPAGELDTSQPLKFLDKPDKIETKNSMVERSQSMEYGFQVRSRSILPQKSTHSSARFKDGIFNSRKRKHVYSAFVRTIST